MDGCANVTFSDSYVRSWTQEQISFLSDVIASGTLLQTQRLGALEGFEKWEGVGLRAVEMTFSVSRTFKGEVPPEGKIVVRYYEAPANRDAESAMEADEEGTQSYLLYLLEEANNRFVPTSGPMEARVCIRPEPPNGGEQICANNPAGLSPHKALPAASVRATVAVNPQQVSNFHRAA